MKKFTQLNESKENFDKKELEMGIKIESEHGDVYDEIDSYLQSYNIVTPWEKEEFYEKIAKAHLREIPDYYSRLTRMEKESK